MCPFTRNHICSMKTKNRKHFKENLFSQWVYFCIYWGAFAIVWHFASYVESDFSERSILYESNWFTPISSIYFYLMGAYVVYMDDAPEQIPIISRVARFLAHMREKHR